MARTHNRLSSRVWTGQTARELRAQPLHVRLFQFWLMTNADAIVEPYGLYHVEFDTAVLQIGVKLVSRPDLEAAMEVLEGEDFCEFDQRSEWIWIREMAAHQVLESYQPLKERDWRVRAAQKFYDALPDIAQLGPFYDHYADLLGLQNRRASTQGRPGRRQGASGGQGAPEAPNPTPTPTPIRRSDLLDHEDLPAPTNGALVVRDAQIDATREAFEAWWAIYPVKTGKGKAWSAWLKHKPPVAKLMDTTRAYEDSTEWEPRQDGRRPIPYPATFLNAAMWDDTPTARSGRVVLGAKNAAMVDRVKDF